MIIRVVAVLALLAGLSGADVDPSNQGRYVLPSLDQLREVRKPEVPADLANYFQLQGQAHDILRMLPIGTGIIPPANFDVIPDPTATKETDVATAAVQQLLGGANALTSNPSIDNILKGLYSSAAGGGNANPALNNILQALYSGPTASGTPGGVPPGNTGAGNFLAGSGLPVGNQAIRPGLPTAGNNLGFSGNGFPQLPVTGFQARASAGGNGTRSSIAGIPKIFPSLPPAPIPQPQIAPRLPTIPQISTRPEVPQGGFGPLRGPDAPLGGPLPPVGQPPGTFGGGSGLLQGSGLGSPGLGGPPPLGGPLPPGGSGQASFVSGSGLLNGVGGGNNIPQRGYNRPLTPRAPPPPSGNNIVRQLMGLFGLGGNSGAGGASGGGRLPNLDLGALNSLFGINPQNQGLLSSVIYNTLTDGVIQPDNNGTKNQTSASAARAASNLKANVALIQQLITQPNSPFCNPKPEPVESFDVDAFMGTWYQVLYSPPMSSGPCSMVAYKKLADVANGGPGTVFDTFEYTTEGTPFGRPRISSGYAILRAPGQLIYRTTSSPTDVNVQVLETGPTNRAGQYEYAVLAVNCNYPLHVFARDPVTYKQKYEAEVNSKLERKGLTNGFSRLLNVVAPVDSTLCNFPPTLFNIRG